jgi:putative intracellular protease/amidase
MPLLYPTSRISVKSVETMYPIQRLKEEGYTVHVAAPKKKVIQTVVHDFEPHMDTYTAGRAWPDNPAILREFPRLLNPVPAR